VRYRPGALVALLAAMAVTLSGFTAIATAGNVHAHASAVTLTVLEHQQLRIDALKKTIIPQFEAAEKKAGKDVHVKLVEEVLPDDQFASKLTLQYSQGKGPDVTSFVASSVPDYAAAGYLLDLSSRVNAWPDWKKHFYPVVRQLTAQGGGKIYSLPRGATTLQLFYRKDVLQKLGISTAQPTSWSSLIARLTQIEAKTGKPSVVYPSGTQWGGGSFDEGFMHVFLGTGGKLYDPASKKWIVKSAALTKAFGFYATLQQAKLLPDDALLSPQPWQPTKYVDFVKGTLPVTTSGSWAWQYDWGPGGGAPIKNLRNVVATWQFPTANGGTPFVTANLDWAWAIAKSTKNPDVAWDWVKFLNTGTALAEDITAAGSLAPRDDIRGVAPYSAHAVLVNSEKQLRSAKVFKPAPGIAKIQEAVGKATEEILTGKADGPKAAADFTSLASKLLGKGSVQG
jgi:multiple sugar transport system substrate-binding protein